MRQLNARHRTVKTKAKEYLLSSSTQAAMGKSRQMGVIAFLDSLQLGTRGSNPRGIWRDEKGTNL